MKKQTNIIQHLRIVSSLLVLILLTSTTYAEGVNLSLLGSYRILDEPMELGWENAPGAGVSGELFYTEHIRFEGGIHIANFDSKLENGITMFWIQLFGNLGYDIKIHEKFSIIPSIGFSINTVYFNEPGIFTLTHNQGNGSIDETEMGFYGAAKFEVRPIEKYSFFVTPEYHRVLSNPIQPSIVVKTGVGRRFKWKWLDY